MFCSGELQFLAEAVELEDEIRVAGNGLVAYLVLGRQ